MKNRKQNKLALALAIMLLTGACQPSEKEKVLKISQDFAELYYNLNIRRAKFYCTEELHTIMNFRHFNIKDKDRKLQQQIGKATVEILNCDMDEDHGIAYVEIAVNNFLRVNYLTDSLSVIPRDTIELVLTKEWDDVWRIKHPV